MTKFREYIIEKEKNTRKNYIYFYYNSIFIYKIEIILNIINIDSFQNISVLINKN